MQTVIEIQPTFLKALLSANPVLGEVLGITTKMIQQNVLRWAIIVV